MNERQLSLDTFYSFVEEKVSESNKIEFKKFLFPDGMCITNGKGYWTDSYWEKSEKLHSDYIQAVDIIWNDGQALNEIFPPCFDSLANAFGYQKSFMDFGTKG